MLPRLLPGISSYFLMWLLALVVCAGVGAQMIRRRREAFVPRFCFGSLLFGVILLGSKLLYLLEAATFPAADYVPEASRGLQHGFRIPGGMLLLAAMAPLSARTFGIAWKEYADSFVLVVAIMLIFVRLGCFLNGCCFGRVSDLPWALSFPPESWVYFYQVRRGWIAADTGQSLAVHPLQLYFLTSAILSLLLMAAWSASSRRAGDRYLGFLGLFFGTTLLLEPLRANRLPPNEWIALLGTLAVGGSLWWRHWGRAPGPAMPS